MKIRFATIKDAPELLKIYEQYIDTPITFVEKIPSLYEYEQRIDNIIRRYPYLVCKSNNVIIGYAYAHRQMERDAYQWNAELSVYLLPDYTSRGFGKILYSILIDILKLQGIKNVYGGVTLPNEKSEKLHYALGFNKLGIYRNTGYKCGKWHDVIWFEKKISEYDPTPKRIKPINVINNEAIISIINNYL